MWPNIEFKLVMWPNIELKLVMWPNIEFDIGNLDFKNVFILHFNTVDFKFYSSNPRA